MKTLQGLLATRSSSVFTPIHSLLFNHFIYYKRRRIHSRSNYSHFSILEPFTLSLSPRFSKRLGLSIICSSNTTQISSLTSDFTAITNSAGGLTVPNESESQWNVEIVNPNVPSHAVRSAGSKFSFNDQAFFLLAFIACTTSVAFAGFVAAAVPTLLAMTKAATSLAKLADTASEELPSTMAAIRLSGMEISDLTLELNDLSHQISDGVTKSAQVVQAAETGVRQIGTMAREHTVSMIQERANLPVISLRPVVSGAAKKTFHAVGQATRRLMNFISGGDVGSEKENDMEY